VIYPITCLLCCAVVAGTFGLTCAMVVICNNTHRIQASNRRDRHRLHLPYVDGVFIKAFFD
jgi:hypothetical protein